MAPVRAAVARHRWATAAGALLSVAMVAGLLHELLGDGLAGLTRAVPASPLFLLAFAAAYLAPPLGDWLIFRRLWGPLPGGFAAVVRKRVANEVVLGYSGEAYLYAWARSRGRGVEAPFAAVKDVSILSALAGNAGTLAAAAAALPFVLDLLPDAAEARLARGGLLGVAVLAATSLPLLLFRRRVFSLPAPLLRWVFGVHLARVAASTLLVALTWAAGVPGVGPGTWAMLAAGRLVVSRLPLVPNKDLLFANLALLVLGSGAVGGAGAVGSLVAFTAALTLLVHAALVAGFALQALWLRRARR